MDRAGRGQVIDRQRVAVLVVERMVTERGLRRAIAELFQRLDAELGQRSLVGEHDLVILAADRDRFGHRVEQLRETQAAAA